MEIGIDLNAICQNWINYEHWKINVWMGNAGVVVCRCGNIV
jgi:hypothetical protein